MEEFLDICFWGRLAPTDQEKTNEAAAKIMGDATGTHEVAPLTLEVINEMGNDVQRAYAAANMEDRGDLKRLMALCCLSVAATMFMWWI